MSARRAHLLFDSISENTGDIAIGLASAQILSERGIAPHVADPFLPNLPRPLIVGGGDLLRVKGDPFYDLFRPKGHNILNAAGVWSTADDLGYLTDYSFVSGRTERETEVLRKWVPEAEVVPCTTTILRSEHFAIPGLEPGEPVIGIQLVPHSLRLIEDLVPILNAIPYKKVFIPFTHYNADESFMKTLPFDRTNSIFLDRLSPLELHSVIGQMSRVVASSLHISIFSYSQNVPFISIHQDKISNYFEDRKLQEHIVQTGPELETMIKRLDSEEFDFSTEIAADRSTVESAFDRYVEILAHDSTVEPGTAFLAPKTTIDRDALKRLHAADIVSDRDITLGLLEARRVALRAEKNAQASALELLSADNAHLQERTAHLQTELEDRIAEITVLQAGLARVLGAWDQRVKRLLRHPLRVVRNRLAFRRAD